MLKTRVRVDNYVDFPPLESVVKVLRVSFCFDVLF